MQPVPKAAYRSDFRENTNFCPQRDSNLGPLAQQASVLPLDQCHELCWTVGAGTLCMHAVAWFLVVGSGWGEEGED